jgi:hypothetical protein
MGIKQISVFLENTTGRIGKVARILADAGINLRAISVADTTDFGILRLIVDKPDAAAKALIAAGFTTITQTTVAAVEVDDKPGSLAALLELFEKSGINIEYMYASLEGECGKAVVIFKLENYEKGFEILTQNGLKMAEGF